jgi:5'(3')-deoxyribonucleotidase
VVAVDFDDTLVYNASRIIEAYNRRHQATITLNDVYVAGALGNVERGWRHSESEALNWIRDFLLSEEGLAHGPQPEVPAILQRLKGKYDLIVATGRTGEWSDGTTAWLDQFLPGIFKGIYHSGEMIKPQFCTKLGVQIMIDDNPRDLGLCVEVGVRGILFGDYPWNRPSLVAHEVDRAKDWIEVERLLLHE